MHSKKQFSETCSNPSPHINGVQPPAVGKQEQVPFKPYMADRCSGMPSKEAALPKSIVK